MASSWEEFVGRGILLVKNQDSKQVGHNGRLSQITHEYAIVHDAKWDRGY